ncbi:MAG: hypothetical protein ACRC5T_04055 [Cetobacterium sp.]
MGYIAQLKEDIFIESFEVNYEYYCVLLYTTKCLNEAYLFSESEMDMLCSDFLQYECTERVEFSLVDRVTTRIK